MHESHEPPSTTLAPRPLERWDIPAPRPGADAHAPVKSISFVPAAISISCSLRSAPWMTVAV